jgi:phosphate transport system permease protein
MTTSTYDTHAANKQIIAELLTEGIRGRRSVQSQFDQRAEDFTKRSLRLQRSERLFDFFCRVPAFIVVAMFGGIFLTLFLGAIPALSKFGFAFFWTDAWNPVTEKFGAAPAIVGTLLTSAIAMCIAVPTGIGIAIFLTEMCPPSIKKYVGLLVELLAGIPSIVYGIWGLFVFAPYFQEYIQPWLIDLTSNVPLLQSLFAGPPYGIGLITGGLILSVMVLPFISAITRDVFDKVPQTMKEAAYGLGCTKWEVVRDVVIPYARRGVFAGAMLALGRALGETMAITFVIGNAHHLHWSLFAPSTTISATLANEFTEAVGDMYMSSLVALGLALFVITAIVIGIAYWMLNSYEKNGARWARLKDWVRNDKRAEGAAADRARRSSDAPPPKITFNLANYRRRMTLSKIRLAPSVISAGFGLGALGWILYTLISRGASGLTLDLFTRMTPAPGEMGGLANAILGSLFMSAIAIVFGTGVGLLAGTYLANQYRFDSQSLEGWFMGVVRILNDILLSAPSIIIGLFIYVVFVLSSGHFSGWAGSAALAVIVAPIVTRTTENALLLVPNGLLEAAASFGAPRGSVAVRVTWIAAWPGILTGVLLAFARISGETAPLLFTALNNQFWSTNLGQPIASLPAVIFQFAMSPYEDWHKLAWAGALLVTAFVLGLSFLGRSIDSSRR